MAIKVREYKAAQTVSFILWKFLCPGYWLVNDSLAFSLLLLLLSGALLLVLLSYLYFIFLFSAVRLSSCPAHVGFVSLCTFFLIFSVLFWWDLIYFHCPSLPFSLSLSLSLSVFLCFIQMNWTNKFQMQHFALTSAAAKANSGLIKFVLH